MTTSRTTRKLSNSCDSRMRIWRSSSSVIIRPLFLLTSQVTKVDDSKRLSCSHQSAPLNPSTESPLPTRNSRVRSWSSTRKRRRSCKRCLRYLLHTTHHSKKTEDKLDQIMVEVLKMENSKTKDNFERTKLDEKLEFERNRMQVLEIDLNDLSVKF